MTPEQIEELARVLDSCDPDRIDHDLCIRQAKALAPIIDRWTSEAREWQPIETAPRDGTRFLAGRFVAKCPRGRAGFMSVDYWHNRKENGYTGLGHFNEQFWPATDWMPLPTPPETDNA